MEGNAPNSDAGCELPLSDLRHGPVRAEGRILWSQDSDRFLFMTKRAGNPTRESPDPTRHFPMTSR